MTGEGTSEVGTALLNFRFGNYLSYRNDAQISMIAGRTAERDAVRHVPWNGGESTTAVLPFAVIYGANGAGKSNVLKALSFMRDVVVTSFQRGTADSPMAHHPFQFDSKSRDLPSLFEIDVVLDGVRHIYGFEHDRVSVTSEWWHWWPNGRRATVVERDADGQMNLGAPGRDRARLVSDVLRKNALFLSTAAAMKHELAEALYGWFTRNLSLADEGTRPRRHRSTVALLRDKKAKEMILGLARAADLGIVGAVVEEPDAKIVETFATVMSTVMPDAQLDTAEVSETLGELRLEHVGEDGPVYLDAEVESLGTMVWLGLLGPVTEALLNGSVLLADELDGSLHPLLVRRLLALFKDPEMNPRRAQLIANSHDITLLDQAEDGSRLVGRDQCWFSTKNSDGSSILYPLTDFDPRKQESVGRRYLKGHYGALPLVSEHDFADVLSNATHEAEH